MAGASGGRNCETEEVSLGDMRGLLVHARPAAASSESLQKPQDLSSCAVVLLPDVFGFDTPETLGAAKLVARQGYTTLVTDIYRGKASPQEAEQGGAALTEWCSLQDRERMLADVKVGGG